MTTKTLGQIAWDAIGDVPWQSLEAWQQKDCETMAHAVAAVVRERLAQACEEAWHIDGSATAKEFAAAIRSMK